MSEEVRGTAVPRMTIANCGPEALKGRQANPSGGSVGGSVRPHCAAHASCVSRGMGKGCRRPGRTGGKDGYGTADVF